MGKEGGEGRLCDEEGMCVCEYICLHISSLALHICTHSDARIERAEVQTKTDTLTRVYRQLGKYPQICTVFVDTNEKEEDNCGK